MRRLNIADPAFTYDETDPEGFRAGMFRLGGELGAKETGTTVYELPSGQALCPYHYEYGEEEWLLVLSGHPTLRTPEGEQRLEPHDVVFFPKGPDGAHGVRNDTDETVRVAHVVTGRRADRDRLSRQRQGRDLDRDPRGEPHGAAVRERGLLLRRDVDHAPASASTTGWIGPAPFWRSCAPTVASVQPL